MGYVRLFRRVRLAPGVSLNLSGSGPSVSLGVRGAHLTLGGSGVRRTVGIPRTGLFYTSRAAWWHESPASDRQIAYVWIFCPDPQQSGYDLLRVQ